MPTPFYVFDRDILTKIASQFDDQSARCYSIYTTVLDEANTLNPFFKGRAHDAFVRRLQAFENDFRMLEELLFKYATYLKETAWQYDMRNETVAAQANKLKVGK
jgi:uncharacterized protein YukE